MEPSEVDPHNGYRYYSQDQIQAAQVIRRLRGLHMPVAEVKAVLAATDSETRNRLIVDHLNHLEDDLAQTAAAVSELRDLLERPHALRTIEHRTVARTPGAGIQATVDREDALAWWRGALGELHATVQAQALSPTGPSGGLYASEIFQYGRGEATVFIPTTGPVKPIGRVIQVVIPEAELAIARHDGSLIDIDLTYGELGAHVLKHEISVDGPLRESYLRGFLDTLAADEWKTEIGWPIFRADARS